LLVVALAAAVRLLAVQRHALHLSDALKTELEAGGYAVVDDAKEAEAAIEKSLAIRKQYLGNAPPALSTIKMVTECLIADGRLHDAEQLMHRIATPSLLARPEYTDRIGHGSFLISPTDLSAYLTGMCAAGGDWEAALPYAALKVKLKPNDSDGYRLLAPLLVVTTNVVAYRELCMKMITTFSNSTDLFVAERIAKNCLILPSSGADLKAISALIDLPVARGKDYVNYAIFKSTKALAEYRQEHFAQAIEWAGLSMVGAEANAYAIISMAQYNTDSGRGVAAP
jgi:hypothetical protein